MRLFSLLLQIVDHWYTDKIVLGYLAFTGKHRFLQGRVQTDKFRMLQLMLGAQPIERDLFLESVGVGLVWAIHNQSTALQPFGYPHSCQKFGIKIAGGKLEITLTVVAKISS